ncbi:MAG: PQQ-like beta-propeller repeat protein [Phycisphaerales bacterium]|nr:PQQ-like beta-propeller repeat protein [Phycisphaerales bacterium]
MKMKYTLGIVIYAAACNATVLASDWPQLAGGALHTSHTFNGPAGLGVTLWRAEPNAAEEYIALAAPVVSQGRVFVAARRFDGFDHVATLLIAYDADSGDRLWTAPMEPDEQDSWSSPAVDAARERVLFPSGFTLYAFEVDDGAPAWTTEFMRPVVNASPTVAGDRVLMSDAKGFGVGSRLYAVNAAPFDKNDNPYQPGDVVWDVDIGASTGATASVVGATVYVANIDGEIMAVDLGDGAEVWRTDFAAVVGAESAKFFSGLAARGGALYGATYNFNGSANSSWLVKLDRATGAIAWRVPCARSRSIPIATDDGRILLAGGIAGFGSNTTVQAFADNDTSATMLWDTAVDAPALGSIGGWTTQPLYSRGRLFVGEPAPPGDFFGPYQRLLAIRPALTPEAPGFVVQEQVGAGGSCAVSDQRLYSIGVDGLFCIDGSDAPHSGTVMRGPTPTRWSP